MNLDLPIQKCYNHSCFNAVPYGFKYCDNCSSINEEDRVTFKMIAEWIDYFVSEESQGLFFVRSFTKEQMVNHIREVISKMKQGYYVHFEDKEPQ